MSINTTLFTVLAICVTAALSAAVSDGILQLDFPKETAIRARRNEHRRNRRNCPDDERSKKDTQCLVEKLCPLASTLALLVETNAILTKQNAHLLKNCVRPTKTELSNRFGNEDDLNNIDQNRNWGLSFNSIYEEEIVTRRPLNFDQDLTNLDTSANRPQQTVAPAPPAQQISRDNRPCVVAFIMCCDNPNEEQCLQRFQCRNTEILKKCSKERVESLIGYVSDAYHLIQ